MWPSVDHVEDPSVPNLVFETRLVNDMKTILTQEEFRKVIGHLAHVLSVQVGALADNWVCDRSYGVKQGTGEPPLPK